ncbi:MAG: M23 family metallopeptidase [Clostridia bacterium]|nr:M23 family metallopeptidase [Clostridia bacterium]
MREMFKKVVIHTKRSIKFIVLFMISTFLIVGAIAFLYKPTYSVFMEGEQIGYTENKAELQHKINTYIENGEEEEENVAFVQVSHLPSYRLCLLKKNTVANDEEIFEKVKEQGIPYYRYYAVADGEEEKAYVSTFEEAEQVVAGLKEKNSSNLEKIAIIEKYEESIQELITSEEAVSKLYAEPIKTVSVAKEETTGSVNTSLTTSKGKANIGISFIRPVSGVISSRFGAGSSMRKSSHTGLDIAASTGTPIAAAASGTVTFSGTKGSYGKMLVITHGNGVQTYYGHCNALYVSAGTQVSQGQIIGEVGSTGNSTGPHLHLEVRVNGVAYNPQNYVY